MEAETDVRFDGHMREQGILLKDHTNTPSHCLEVLLGDRKVTNFHRSIQWCKITVKMKEKGGFTNGPLIVECVEKGDLATVNSEARKACRFLKKLMK